MSHLSNVRFSTADLMFKVSNMGRLPSEKFSFRMVTSFWEGVPLVVVGLYLHKAEIAFPKVLKLNHAFSPLKGKQQMVCLKLRYPQIVIIPVPQKVP